MSLSSSGAGYRHYSLRLGDIILHGSTVGSTLSIWRSVLPALWGIWLVLAGAIGASAVPAAILIPKAITTVRVASTRATGQNPIQPQSQFAITHCVISRVSERRSMAERGSSQNCDTTNRLVPGSNPGEPTTFTTDAGTMYRASIMTDRASSAFAENESRW
jgi:hypothetical protein